jgi:hypothetical protein
VNGQVGDVQERAVTAQIDQLYFFGWLFVILNK